MSMPSVLYKGEYKPINYFLYGFVTFIALYCHTTISYFANLIKYPFHQRSVTEVKKKWSDIKLDVKRRLARRRRAMGLTGGGQDTQPPPSPMDERILSIIGM